MIMVNLKRIRHANIELTGLKKGQIKQIKPRQIKELKAYLLAKRGDNESSIKLLESLLRKKEKDYRR